MPLLLLPRGVAPADVVDTPPAEDAGVGTQFPATSGVWRFSLEIATTATSPDWYDITQFYAGDRYQRGADDYKGKYRASLATVQLQIDLNQATDLAVSPDILAPWGQDTTDLFGINIRLGAGLLMRASMVRVVAAVVVEWLPLWTGRVESWGDASFARGQIRVHEVSVVDTIADLANVPVFISAAAIGGGTGTTWNDWIEDFLLPQAGWQFGLDIYGDTGSPDLPVDEVMQPSALTRMDAATDPIGLVWRSLRTGRLVVHPAPWDTTNVNRYPNPLLDVYPGGLVFSYAPDFTDIEYIADHDQQPFGIQRTVAGILNSFVVTAPGVPDPDVYPVDDPVSVGRYGVRPFTATWLVENHPVVDDLLADRAYAESQALPLRTTVDHEGFWTALAIIDHLDPVTVIHATSDDGLVVTGTGSVRNIVEERSVRTDGLLNWQSTVQIDIDSTETSEPLLPVEDLTVSSISYNSAIGSWTNPTQPSITPTEVQYRLLGRSLIWVSKAYPGVGGDLVALGSLSQGTAYTLQVRLVRRVDGVVTNFSASRSYRFTTPVLAPIPVPDGTDTDAEIPEDDPDCDLEVELQENDGTTVPYADGWVTVDTFTGAELTDNGDGTFSLTTPIPNSFFNDGSMYRFRSSCDGVDWLAGPEFDPPDDWTDPCSTPPALSDPPFNDPSLLVYVPKICTGAEDGDPDFVFNGMQIIETVSGIPGVPGDALEAIVTGVGDPDEHALLALPDPAWSDAAGGILAYGECPQIVGAVGDKTITCRVNVSDAVDCVLFECAAMRITCTATTAGWRPGVTIYKVGSTISLPGVMVLDEGTAYVITATHELATGTINLYVDGALDNTVGGTDNVNTIAALPIWRVGAPPESWITDCALFGEPITPVLTLPDAIVALNPLGYWKLDETAGTTAINYSSAGAARDGTYTAVNLASVAGPDTNYAQFANAGNRVDVGDINDWSLNTAPGLTVFALIKPAGAASGRQFVVAKGGANPSYEWELDIGATGSMSAVTFTDIGGAIQGETINSVITTNWQAVCAAWDNATYNDRFNIYRNSGTPLASSQVTVSPGSYTNGVAEVWIGFRRDNGASRFDGGIAHVAIFAGPLTPTQIGTLMTAAQNDGWF